MYIELMTGDNLSQVHLKSAFPFVLYGFVWLESPVDIV